MINNRFHKPHSVLTHWAVWAVLGLLIAAGTIWGVVHMASRTVERNASLRSPQYSANTTAAASSISFEKKTVHTAGDGLVKIEPEEVPAAETAPVS